MGRDRESDEMALREFRDRGGALWRVWAVTPDFMHPATAAEDYLGDYQEGWLTFECEHSRRRLARIPHGWDELPEAELERLLESAEQAVRRQPGVNSGQHPAFGKPETANAPARSEPRPAPAAAAPRPAAPPASPARELTPTGRRRIFTDPAGHVVIAGVERPSAEPAPAGGASTCDITTGVLRFRADDKHIFDLPEWPDDWERLPKAELVALYERARQTAEREAAQRAAERASRPQEPAASPRRRATDRRE